MVYVGVIHKMKIQRLKCGECGGVGIDYGPIQRIDFWSASRASLVDSSWTASFKEVLGLSSSPIVRPSNNK